MAGYVKLAPGDPAPWFYQRTSGNPRFSFDTAAGRYIVLCFFATAGDARSRAAIDAVLARRDLFDDEKASFFGVSLDPADEAERRVGDLAPGVRYFWDFDGAVSALYGVIPKDAGDRIGGVTAMRRWFILDPTLRVIDVIPFDESGRDIEAAAKLREENNARLGEGVDPYRAIR